MVSGENIPIREREDAMSAYLMMFAAAAVGLPLPTINLVAALIYWYLNRSKSRFIKFHILQSLYSQIVTSFMNIVLIFWSVRIFLFKTLEFTDVYKGYLVITLIANMMYFVFSIVAAVKARKGQFFYFMVIGQITYQQVYDNKKEIELPNS